MASDWILHFLWKMPQPAIWPTTLHFPILFIFYYKEILKARKLGCSSSHCSFNFRPKNMEPVQGVRRRKIFSNTAGVLNWPSFSISIDFPTVYIDFLNILSKVGSREATWNNVIGNKSQDTLKLRTVLLFRNNFCSLFTHVNKILSITEFRGKNILLLFFF